MVKGIGTHGGTKGEERKVKKVGGGCFSVVLAKKVR